MIKKLVFISAITLFLISCEEKPHKIVEHTTKYAFVNKSGVEVAIVPKESKAYIPDSLVLQNGGSYCWDVLYPYPINRNNDPVYIYFNKTVVVRYFDYPGTARDPRHSGQYTDELVKDGLSYYTYTFTAEDYQRALELNNSDR